MIKYRTHDPALHAGRMGKIVVAIDDGTIDQYTGKSVEEIDSTVVEDAEAPGEVVLHEHAKSTSTLHNELCDSERPLERSRTIKKRLLDTNI